MINSRRCIQVIMTAVLVKPTNECSRTTNRLEISYVVSLCLFDCIIFRLRGTTLRMMTNFHNHNRNLLLAGEILTGSAVLVHHFKRPVDNLIQPIVIFLIGCLRVVVDIILSLMPLISKERSFRLDF